jgi:membrane protein required for colicin V production
LTAVDILISVILALSVLVGAMRGLVRELVALVFWIAALWGAWLLGPRVEPYLGGLLSGPHVRVWVARLVVLVGVLCVGAVVGMIMGLLARSSGLGWLDRLLGMMFGLARALVLLGVLAIGGELLHLHEESWWSHSRLIPYCVVIGDWERALVGEKGEPWSRLERITGVRIR